jgi:transcriptional regulator with XRE-family HTH domain
MSKNRKELGEQVKAYRQAKGVSTYRLEKMGSASGLPATIEGGKRGYTIDTLFEYLQRIDEAGDCQTGTRIFIR